MNKTLKIKSIFMLNKEVIRKYIKVKDRVRTKTFLKAKTKAKLTLGKKTNIRPNPNLCDSKAICSNDIKCLVIFFY